MDRHMAAHPGVHLHEARRLHLLDVDSFAVVEYGEVSRQMTALHQSPQLRQRIPPDVQSVERPPAEAERFQPKPVLVRLAVAAQVAAPFERPQNVAGRTLGYPQPPADFGVGHPVVTLGERFQSRQRPIDRSLVIFVIFLLLHRTYRTYRYYRSYNLIVFRSIL